MSTKQLLANTEKYSPIPRKKIRSANHCKTNSHPPPPPKTLNNQESPNTPYKKKYEGNHSGTNLNDAGMAMMVPGCCCNFKRSQRLEDNGICCESSCMPHRREGATKTGHTEEEGRNYGC